MGCRDMEGELSPSVTRFLGVSGRPGDGDLGTIGDSWLWGTGGE